MATTATGKLWKVNASKTRNEALTITGTEPNVLLFPTDSDSIIFNGKEYRAISAADKTKLDGIQSGAQVNAVTSVVGRTGAVTLSKTDVGLSNVSNDAQVKRSEMGSANGVATLGSDGKVPSAQLPSYVDDVLEYANKAGFPATGESGKIYMAKDTNLTYRWGDTTYVEISPSIALGETASTAYPGNKGKQNATNIAGLKTKVGYLPGYISDLTNYVVYGDTISGLRINASQINFDNGEAQDLDIDLPPATTTEYGVMSPADKTKLNNVPLNVQNDLDTIKGYLSDYVSRLEILEDVLTIK